MVGQALQYDGEDRTVIKKIDWGLTSITEIGLTAWICPKYTKYNIKLQCECPEDEFCEFEFGIQPPETTGADCIVPADWKMIAEHN